MYALKPMPDPKTIRYPSASQEHIEIAPRCRRPNSPANKPAIRRITPPVRLCIATPSIAELGIPPCLEYSEPQAQAREATTSTAAPRGSTRSEPPRCAGPTSSARPANPIRSPIATLGAGFTPPGRSQSTITSQSDTVATSSAAIPEGTVCSAQLTPPLPMNRSRAPVTTAVLQLAAVGLIPVFQRRIG